MCEIYKQYSFPQEKCCFLLVIKKNAKEFLKNLTMQHRQLKREPDLTGTKHLTAKETASFFPSKRQQTKVEKICTCLAQLAT